jgi:anti-repressor protein
MWFVTEDGLMEILIQSRKPIAKELKKQVKEILKTIRKFGMYMTPATSQESIEDPEIHSRYMKLIAA